MMQRYEVIEYGGTNFKFTSGWIRHVTPHLHREFELGIALDGRCVFSVREDSWEMMPGDMWLLNPFENHEVHITETDRTFEYVELQVAPAFFRDYYPDIDKTRFQSHHLTEETLGKERMSQMRTELIRAALAYFEKKDFYQLECAGKINKIFRQVLEHVPFETLDKAQEAVEAQANLRMQRINHMIEERYDGKLLLNDIAEEEGLTLHYLSHFFKKNWGMSFQEYLLHFRCAKARELLTSTRMPVADISYVCGFSDPKYMRQGFRRLYGEELSEVRQNRVPSADRPESEHFRLDESVYTESEAVPVLKHFLPSFI